MLHAMPPVVVLNYDMYLVCVEGSVDPKWEESNTINLYTFRDVMFRQILK